MQMLFQTLRQMSDFTPLLVNWQRHSAALVDLALELQSIPAPSFSEKARAAAVEKKLRSIGLDDVHQDDIHNVYARTPGRTENTPALLVSAHLDTVFHENTDLTVRYGDHGEKIYGPGLGDNSLGVAGMLMLARLVSEAPFVPPCDIYWVASVCEEGLGDLRGMRQVCSQLGHRLGIGLILEGIGLGRLYSAGIGVRRLRVSVQGPGGHSWLNPERPSAIHHLVQVAGKMVSDVTLSNTPRTTFNIGLIEGGRTINTRAPDASMALDLRSTDRDALQTLESQVRSIIANHPLEPGLRVTIDVVGDRPSSHLPDKHPLVQIALAALQSAGFPDVIPEAGSTDANIPLALGIPTLCLGITGGGDSHTLQEYIETRPIAQGMEQITLVMIAALTNMDRWHKWDADGNC